MNKTYFQPIDNEDHSKWLFEILEPLSISKDYKEADVLLLSGGEDVNPELYGENIGKYTYVNKKRDLFEINCYNEYINKPKIGICRGAQLLTVLNGGKLIQDVTNHKREHYIRCFDLFKPLIASSDHHQMMWPWVSDNLFYLLAYSEGISSSHYLNGNDQNAFNEILSGGFLSIKEPEIIYWPETKSLCIQGHPEWKNIANDYVNYCRILIDLLIKNELYDYIEDQVD